MNITCHRDLSVNIVILPRSMHGAWPSYFQVGGALVMALERPLVRGHSHQVWTRFVSRMAVVWGWGRPRARVTRGVRGQHHPPGYRGYPPARALMTLASRVTSAARGREARSGEDAASGEGDSLHIRPGLSLLVRAVHDRGRLQGGWNCEGVINWY